MTTDRQTKQLSKFLSYVLRHHPETLNLSPDKNGWVSVEELLSNWNAEEHKVDRELLQHIVSTNRKKRFAFNESGTMIRASQGHSISVDLGYTPMQPPAVLFHGTVEKNIEAILSQGLVRMERHHVHLSADVATAAEVGQRHGKPVILQIASGRMHEDGHIFYRSDNGVWLTEAVGAGYITVKKD